MNFNLYHHDDLDGIASSAVFLEFLRSRGEDYDSMHPLDYGPEMTREHWINMHFKKPFVIFDFQFHPDADWWIDHHGSAFRLTGDSLQKKYKNDKQHFWDPNSLSGTGLVKKFLENEYDFESSEYIKKLVEFVDIDDSATYPSLDAMLELESGYKKLQLLLSDPELHHDDPRYYELREYFVRNIANSDIEDVIENSGYKDRISFLKNRAETLNFELQKRSVLKNNVVFANATDMKDTYVKSSIFKNFPDIPYGISASGHDGNYSIRFFWNNWSINKPTLNLGSIVQEFSADGGGHAGIGAFHVKTREEAIEAINKITDYINKNG